MLNIMEDITSVTKLRQNLNTQVSKVRKNKRPLVVTANGEAAVVMVAASEYQRMTDLLATGQEIMALAEERGKDVFEVEEGIDWIYQQLNLPKPNANE